MVDLWFASDTDRARFKCSTCPVNIQKQRRCLDDGYEGLKTPMAVGSGSLKYSFCPGKATWSVEVAELFEECRIALETGIMPKGQTLDDQDARFVAALPVFIDRWRERTYHRMWVDIGEFTGQVLKSLFPSK